MIWVLAGVAALISLADGLTTWAGLSRHPDHVVETNPVVAWVFPRVRAPVFVALNCAASAALSLLIGLVSRWVGAGSIGQVVYALGIAAAVVNNSRNLRRLTRRPSTGQ